MTKLANIYIILGMSWALLRALALIQLIQHSKPSCGEVLDLSSCPHESSKTLQLSHQAGQITTQLSLYLWRNEYQLLTMML